MDNTNSLLIEYAKTYNTQEFISSDPIQFPHRFKEKKDIEISAFISSWLAYGNRKAILKTLEQLHKEFEKDSLVCLKSKIIDEFQLWNPDCYVENYVSQKASILFMKFDNCDEMKMVSSNIYNYIHTVMA